MGAREAVSHLLQSSSRLTISWKDPSVARGQAAGTVRLAAWIGLLTGCGEVICLGTQKYLLHNPIYFGVHIIWMAPLATAGIFMLIAVLFSASILVYHKLGLVRQQPDSFRKLYAALIFLGILSWVLIFPQINIFAGLLLAAGCACNLASSVELQQEIEIFRATLATRTTVPAGAVSRSIDSRGLDIRSSAPGFVCPPEGENKAVD